jgi:hypothetical protein
LWALERAGRGTPISRLAWQAATEPVRRWAAQSLGQDQPLNLYFADGQPQVDFPDWNTAYRFGSVHLEHTLSPNPELVLYLIFDPSRLPESHFSRMGQGTGLFASPWEPEAKNMLLKAELLGVSSTEGEIAILLDPVYQRAHDEIVRFFGLLEQHTRQTNPPRGDERLRELGRRYHSMTADERAEALLYAVRSGAMGSPEEAESKLVAASQVLRDRGAVLALGGWGYPPAPYGTIGGWSGIWAFFDWFIEHPTPFERIGDKSLNHFARMSAQRKRAASAVFPGPAGDTRPWTPPEGWATYLTRHAWRHGASHTVAVERLSAIADQILGHFARWIYPW